MPHKAQKLTLEGKGVFSDQRYKGRTSEVGGYRLTGNPKFEISWLAISLFDNREGRQAIVIRSRKVKNSLSEQTNKRASDYPRRDKKTLRHERVVRKGRLCYEIFIGIYACQSFGK